MATLLLFDHFELFSVASDGLGLDKRWADQVAIFNRMAYSKLYLITQYIVQRIYTSSVG